MTWIAAGIAGVGAIYKGMQAGVHGAGDVEAGRAAAGDIYQEQVGLLGKQKKLGYAAAESQLTGGQRDVTMGAQIGMRGIQEGAATAASRSGLATSGTIESQVQTQTKDILGKYTSDITKLFETRRLAQTQANLSFLKGEMSAEESYQSTLTGLESTPTTFMEGMFS